MPRALYLLEGESVLLNGNYKNRENPQQDCHNAALVKGHTIFALQDGGQCYSSSLPNDNSTPRFKKYGPSSACRGGKGGHMANSVYEVESKSIFAMK